MNYTTNSLAAQQVGRKAYERPEIIQIYTEVIAVDGDGWASPTADEDDHAAKGFTGWDDVAEETWGTDFNLWDDTDPATQTNE